MARRVPLPEEGFIVTFAFGAVAGIALFLLGYFVAKKVEKMP